jgi:hypothetical protein
LETLAEAVEESERLLASGYERHGNWTLGQACRHMHLTIDASIDGYPWWMSLAAPIRPVLKSLVLPRLMRGDSPVGVKTPGMFVPPGNLDDAEEVKLFSLSAATFTSHEGRPFPHPGFGSMDLKEFEAFHAMHAAHHFGFLAPVQASS